MMLVMMIAHLVFELLEKELVDPAQPSSITSLVLVEGKSSKQISPSYEDMRCIVEYVETELQLSAKNAMTEYVGSFLDSEVRKLVNLSKGENLMKERACKTNKNHKLEEEAKHCDNSGTAKVSPIIGKYTYHRKKLFLKKSGSSRSVTLDGKELENEIVEKSKNLHVSGDMPETTEFKKCYCDS
ncbi:hypothetical protein GBA52_009064 [Prunus armeniaca]|nr:hypothetical protein GBA52_009064 [Prunus armeniaca]